MKISKENKNKLRILCDEDHKIQFMETFMKIVNKEGKIVPFKLTDEQKTLVSQLKGHNIVSKSRQLGISTITISLSIREAILHPYSNCLLVSYDQKSCNAIFNKLKQQFDLLPSFLKPKTKANNRQELTFLNGSRIICACAGNKDIGRGDTYQIVHLSEFAFWKNPETHLNSILQALSPTGLLIIESTSNGLNYYSDLVQKAENNENDFNLYFFNWINGGSLFKNAYKKAVKTYKNRFKKDYIEELDDEEKRLQEIGATMEQLIWRRSMIENIGLDKFHQEYPSTIMESFISTSNNVFNATRLKEMELYTMKVKPLIVRDMSKLLMAYRNSINIYQYPIFGHKYCLGVDTSDGLGQDYSVVEVYDKETGEQVCEFRNNKIAPYDFAEVVKELGLYYNYGLLVVEINKSGNTVIEKLWKQWDYKNLYKYKRYNEFNKLVYARGFSTDSTSKPMIINNLREAVDKYSIKINSRTSVIEMKFYDSTFNASQGHDDTVISNALAVEGMKYRYWYV